MAATDDLPGTVSSVTSGALSTLDTLSSNITTGAQDILDRFFPPEQREALLAKIKAFALANPKVSAFLGMNIALTGIPLGLFTLFGLSVAVCSVLGGIILGLLGAMLFTLTCIGIALMFVFPVLMFTTGTACFLFLFGLAGYKILKWASGREQGDSGDEGEKATTVGDSLNAITGGRLSGFIESAKMQQDKNDIEGFSDEKNPARTTQSPQHTKTQSDMATTKPETGKTMKTTTSSNPATPVAAKAVKAMPLGPISQKVPADKKKTVTGVVGV